MTGNDEVACYLMLSLHKGVRDMLEKGAKEKKKTQVSFEVHFAGISELCVWQA